MDLLTDIITGVLGGLGLFIYGIYIMAEGMQKAAGDKLRSILEVLTTNPFISMLTGVALTVLVQSSSTSTVMVVSFVNAGLIGLTQAVGTIFGANIGTTITAQLVSFDLGMLALPAIAIGTALFMFSKRRVRKNIGKATLGFGILFLGMTLLSDSLAPLSEEPLFLSLLERFGQTPLLGVLAGAIFTVMVQSSSAASGVIIALTFQGLLDLQSGIALIMGTNIGTCVTTLLAGIGANLGAKRTAAAHIIFNSVGTLAFLIILPFFTNLAELTADTVPRQVANAHTIFNVGAALLFLPFTSKFAALMERIIPGEELKIEHGSKYLDKRVVGTPMVAIANSKNEIVRMAKIAGEMVEESLDDFISSDTKKMQYVRQKEKIVDQLEKEIVMYLSEISHNSLSINQSKQLTSLMNAVNDIERIGDHSENLIDLAQNRLEDNLPFTQTALDELKDFCEKVHKMYLETIEALEKNDAEKAREMIEYDDVIDEMEKVLRKHHINRLNEKRCHLSSGVIYLDILSNFERIGDHSSNLCHVVLGED